MERAKDTSHIAQTRATNVPARRRESVREETKGMVRAYPYSWGMGMQKPPKQPARNRLSCAHDLSRNRSVSSSRRSRRSVINVD